MKIKVCGMKYPENIKAIQKLKPDFMGFIFYEKSPRLVDEELLRKIDTTDKKISTVGVFVNASITEITKKVNDFSFDYVQLHGNESAEFVKELNEEGIQIIKAFQIDENFDWGALQSYQKSVNYFLFDTPTKNYGGSGKKFNWETLNNYTQNKPFFLSGGIGIEDIHEIKNLKLPLLFGIDVNSKFETAPGEKDEELVKTMINQIRDERKL
ncbi:phosphoribosylanthranilate isomerase [Brumimicrobium glaciale]|uniref:N-(5'-phosphoribosyl)anthranilate isomerase n=1 Tax=Brumimicrobium glaciale TaxID=200475 RepID=A0A4Q4KRE9_9FLAO|nr:phosphoribosylanthranilate isomerase [Brumimicrobium glaciale]RYM35635.1 phosphoribosylanthranilate isomerase [Brumimicrobium glaciale]